MTSFSRDVRLSTSPGQDSCRQPDKIIVAEQRMVLRLTSQYETGFQFPQKLEST